MAPFKYPGRVLSDLGRLLRSRIVLVLNSIKGWIHMQENETVKFTHLFITTISVLLTILSFTTITVSLKISNISINVRLKTRGTDSNISPEISFVARKLFVILTHKRKHFLNGFKEN